MEERGRFAAVWALDDAKSAAKRGKSRGKQIRVVDTIGSR
jgi:hypothetical protein